jgi:hypothetical protein
MRTFNSEDGRSWTATLHDGLEATALLDTRTGWEIVQFDSTQPGTTQRITYRPSGWLANASIQDLVDALREGESVRASWS